MRSKEIEIKIEILILLSFFCNHARLMHFIARLIRIMNRKSKFISWICFSARNPNIYVIQTND